MGILPRSYTISSWDAFVKEGSLNVQAGTTFVDYEFLDEVCFVLSLPLSLLPPPPQKKKKKNISPSLMTT